MHVENAPLQAELERVLGLYKNYYNISRDPQEGPFAAEAEFSMHDEQYFLIRSAKITEADSREFVFFAAEEQLTRDRLLELDRIAWETGLSRVRPEAGHRNTDVVLVVLAEKVDADALSEAKRLKHYKSYWATLRGWSQYRLVVHDLSGQTASNRQGEGLRELFK